MARGHCASVTSPACEAPSGFAGGGGYASLPQRTGLHRCFYCGEPVCTQCSSEFPELGRACDSHEDAELLDML